MDSLAMLDQAFEAMRTFHPLSEAELAALLAKTPRRRKDRRLRAVQDHIRLRRHGAESQMAGRRAGTRASRNVELEPSHSKLRHFFEDLNRLEQLLLEMAGYVESSVRKSVQCLTEQSEIFANQVIRDEALINQLEIRVDDLATRSGGTQSARGERYAADCGRPQNQHRSGAHGRPGRKHHAARAAHHHPAAH